MRTFLIAIVFVCLAGSVQAQLKPSVPARVAHYVSNHKELLAADAVLIAAVSADAASSVHCQNVAPTTCTETNPILGKHPSTGKTWSLAMGEAAALVTGNHLVWHFAPDPASRHLIWFTAIPIGVTEAIDVHGNVQAAARLEAARARVMER